MTPGKQKILLTAVTILLLAIVIIFSGFGRNLPAFCSLTTFIFSKPLPLEQSEFETIIADHIASGVHKDGVFPLPTSKSDLTADGNMYVTLHPSGNDIYLFVSKIQYKYNSDGYAYCSNPNFLAPDTTENLNGISCYPPYIQLDYVEIMSEITPNWYEIRYGMH